MISDDTSSSKVHYRLYTCSHTNFWNRKMYKVKNITWPLLYAYKTLYLKKTVGHYFTSKEIMGQKNDDEFLPKGDLRKDLDPSVY